MATAPLARKPEPEMDLVRTMIMGPYADQIEQLGRQASNRDLRVRRLAEDIPDALEAQEVNEASLVRMAGALRNPVEQALQMSVSRDGRKIADIIAPAVGLALPRALVNFLSNLPISLVRRVWRLVNPRARRSQERAMPGLFASSAVSNEFPLDVQRLCLFRRDTLDVVRALDAASHENGDNLEVMHLFTQLREAMLAGDPNPAASLKYPPAKDKNHPQGMIVIEGHATTLAAYYTGVPPVWFRDRIQDLADEADAVAASIIHDGSNGHIVDNRIASLDEILKQALIYYVPPATTSSRHQGEPERATWWSDLAVVCAVIGTVWLVATVSQASLRWVEAVNEIDAQPGIVVMERSWIPGSHISGLRDPLAPDPIHLLTKRGYDPLQVTIAFTPFVSDEEPFTEHRRSLQKAERDSVHREISNSFAKALTLMEGALATQKAAVRAGDEPVPAARTDAMRTEILRIVLDLGTTTPIALSGGELVIPDDLPKATRDRVMETAKTISWVTKVVEADRTTIKSEPLDDPDAGAPKATVVTP